MESDEVKRRVKRFALLCSVAFFLSSFMIHEGFSQEDPVIRAALDTVKAQMRVPKDIEIKFLEKKESPIPDFYSVRLLLVAPDREIPILVYVDKEGEKVILGSLFIKGENVTRKEAGVPQPRRIDMALLEIGKSPARGSANPKVTIVEFSNFECPYCLRSWTALKSLLERYPAEIKYVFKHFPFPGQAKAYEFSEMAAAAQEVNQGAFWAVHDFLFSNGGQTLLKGGKEAAKQKIEELLKRKGYDVGSFREALKTGKGKRRVEEDLAVGRTIQVRGTPTTIMNGDFVRTPISDQLIDSYIRK
jgi:protein-disulfide isomerase